MNMPGKDTICAIVRQSVQRISGTYTTAIFYYVFDMNIIDLTTDSN